MRKNNGVIVAAGLTVAAFLAVAAGVPLDVFGKDGHLARSGLEPDSVSPCATSASWKDKGCQPAMHHQLLGHFITLDRVDREAEVAWRREIRAHQRDQEHRGLALDGQAVRLKEHIDEAEAHTRYLSDVYDELQEFARRFQDDLRRSRRAGLLGRGLRFGLSALGVPDALGNAFASGFSAACVGGSPKEILGRAGVGGLASVLADEVRGLAGEESAVGGVSNLHALVGRLSPDAAATVFLSEGILFSGQHLEGIITPPSKHTPGSLPAPESRGDTTIRAAFPAGPSARPVRDSGGNHVGQLPAFRHEAAGETWGRGDGAFELSDALLSARIRTDRLGRALDILTRRDARRAESARDLDILRKQGLNVDLEDTLGRLIELAEEMTRIIERDRAMLERLMAEANDRSWLLGIVRIAASAVATTVGGPLGAIFVAGVIEAVDDGADLSSALSSGFKHAAFAVGVAAAQDLGQGLLSREQDDRVAAADAREDLGQGENSTSIPTSSDETPPKATLAPSASDGVAARGRQAPGALPDEEAISGNGKDADILECTAAMASCVADVVKGATTGRPWARAVETLRALSNCLVETPQACPEEAILPQSILSEHRCLNEALGFLQECLLNPAIFLDNALFEACSNQHNATSLACDGTSLEAAWKWVTGDKGHELAKELPSYWGVDVEELLKELDSLGTDERDIAPPGSSPLPLTH